MSEILPLFSSPVYISDAYITREFSKILEVCESLEYISNKGNNFASTNTDILNHPDFLEIKKIVEHELNEYVKNIMHWDAYEIYITQSWLNVNPPGTNHHQHYHYNSIVSGVFYLQTVDNDTITFYKDDKPLLSIEPSEFNIWNANSFDVPVKSGMMVIFPSRLMHGVETNQSSNIYDNRISIAVNTFVRGQFGSKQNLTYLDLK